VIVHATALGRIREYKNQLKVKLIIYRAVHVRNNGKLAEAKTLLTADVRTAALPDTHVTRLRGIG